MRDPIDVLSAANPVGDCPPLPPDVLREALLRADGPRADHAAVRRRVAFGGSAIALGAVAALLIVLILGSGSSVVSEVYAATADQGDVLSYRVTHVEIASGIQDGRPVSSPGLRTYSRAWSSGSRWHVISVEPAVHNLYISATGGTFEFAASGDTVLRYTSFTPRVIVRDVSNARPCDRLAFELAQSPCGDPDRPAPHTAR